MSIHNIHEAKTRLSKLVEQAERGEEVLIARAGRPVAKLTAYRSLDTDRQGGQWRGKIKIAKDFDDLPVDVARAFGMQMTKKAKPGK
jgi:prevent-host-death family protein